MNNCKRFNNYEQELCTIYKWVTIYSTVQANNSKSICVKLQEIECKSLQSHSGICR